jgi:hypothetical protein
MPVRSAPIELEGSYEGWTAMVRVNMPVVQYNVLFGGSWAERFGALAEVVLEWNFVDDEGMEIPITPDGMELLPLDLLQDLLRRIDEAVAAPLAVSRPS